MMCSILQKRVKNVVAMKNHSTISIRPEINFPEGTDEHDSRVYSEAQRQLAHFIEQGWLVTWIKSLAIISMPKR